MTDEPSIDLSSLGDLASPGLLVDADRVAGNIQRMIQLVGGPAHACRLRPHVKTHKMPDIVKLQLDAGIERFKAATIAEAEMVAGAGAADVLIAYPTVGPNVARLVDLIQRHTKTAFAVVVDCLQVASDLDQAMAREDRLLRTFIDVDGGMGRTGIKLGASLDDLRSFIESAGNLLYSGLHVYDGHIHDQDLGDRTRRVLSVINAVQDYDQSHPSNTVVVGGSPTFAIWAQRTTFQCSPGTPLLWDRGYARQYADLDFEIAAVLLTRVISKPGPGRVCLDLGHKAVGSEMPMDRRVHFPHLPDAKLVGHSEEHLVVETGQAASLPIGQPLIAMPEHICPTVALHARANVVRSGRPTGQIWAVTARDR